MKVSRARYGQLIKAALLDKPFEIVPGSRPVHTESQIRRCEKSLYEMALSTARTSGKTRRRTKPLSEKLLSEIS